MGKKGKNSGAAMVIVLCVMVVFLALSATILLAGSVTLNAARNNVTYERGKVQAASLSEVFARNLSEWESAEKTAEPATPGIAEYVHNLIMSGAWQPYDEEANNEDVAVKTFTMDEEDSRHQIAIELYWTWGGTAAEVTGPTLKSIEKGLGGDPYNVRLIVDVISTLNDSEYHVKRDFRLRIKENSDEASKGEHPYLWAWEAEGRNNSR